MHEHILLTVNDGLIKVTDMSCYEKEGTVDFVCYLNADGSPSVVSVNSIMINSCPEHAHRLYVHQIDRDGFYGYYKIKLPVYNMFNIADIVKIPANIYFIADNKVWFSGKNGVSLTENGSGASFDEADIMDVLNYMLMTHPDFVFNKKIFAIPNLNKCVAKYQKQYLSEHYSDCGIVSCKKEKDSGTKAHRDFLFTASYLIDYLAGIGNYEQALDILNNVSSCGMTLCNDNKSNNCNCNG